MTKKKKSSAAFGDGEDWLMNAIISHDEFSSSDMAYIYGYESVVGSLAAVAKFVVNGGGQPYPGTDVMIDTIIYPQIFCARHFLELSLKYMHKRVGFVGEKDLRGLPGHRLPDLFEWLADATRQHAPDVLIYVEKLRAMVMELSRVDEEGDAFRYPRTKGNDPHLADIQIINIDRFQAWFDRLRKLVHDVFFALDYELYKQEAGGYTKHYNREELEDLVTRLPKIKKWDHAILRPFHEGEKVERRGLSYKQFQLVLARIRKTPWLSLRVGVEIRLSEVPSDLFGRVLAPKGSANIEPEEWGALYCILKVGSGEVPDEYARLMTRARKNAADLEEWNAALVVRRTTMTKKQIEAEDKEAFNDPALSFDTSRMQIYNCDGKIREVLPLRPYIFCRGLEKLGQPTLLDDLRRACEKAGISWAEPSASERSNRTYSHMFPHIQSEP